MVAPRTPTAAELSSIADQRIAMHQVPWSHYEVMLAIRGEAPVPRMAYLEGELELLSPSREHEMIKSVLRRLIEEAPTRFGVDLWPVGSWTVRSAPRQRGVEADECWTLGDPRHKNAPDLALEVVWTSGGIDKLAIYRGLGIREVWFWQDGSLSVHLLVDDHYELASQSDLLPALDLALVARLATSSPADALRELRDSLGD